MTEPSVRAVDEVVGLASRLIRIDTTNTGDAATLAGERVAAEWVAEQLAEVGYETTYVESGARRATTFPRPLAPDST
jgi:acetylornithine deacetylase/succinyl-diaminopimelate desuccinylase-like protein